MQTTRSTRIARLHALQEEAIDHENRVWRAYCRAAQRVDLAECDRLERELAAAHIHTATLEGLCA